MEEEEIRCTGFFATGGAGFLDIEFVEAALLGRLISSFLGGVAMSSPLMMLVRLVLLVCKVLGSNGGGSFR